MSYFRNQPRVYLYNIDTGQQEILGDFPGMTYAPRFSPDGGKVSFSMSRNGNSDIFVMDLRNRVTRRLTKHLAIDTSPSMSPEGDRVTFNSDRSGTQQIYVMNDNGSDVQRITFGQGRYATPVWSPRGDLIAFTRFHKGRFFIGVIRPDGTGERLLTELSGRRADLVAQWPRADVLPAGTIRRRWQGRQREAVVRRSDRSKPAPGAHAAGRIRSRLVAAFRTFGVNGHRFDTICRGLAHFRRFSFATGVLNTGMQP